MATKGLTAPGQELSTEELQRRIRLYRKHLDSLGGAGGKAGPRPEQAMETIRKAPPKEYEYAPQFRGRPGFDAGRHVGPMADDLEKTPLGASVVERDPSGMRRLANGGDRLSVINTAALHDLDKRVGRMEKKR